MTWLAIGVAGVGMIRMFALEEDATFSLVGSLVTFAVPVAAAANFTVMQHVGMNKNRLNEPDNEPAQNMLQAVLIGALLSTIATLPFSWPLQATSYDLCLLSLLGVFQLAVPCLLIVRLSRELSAPEISLLTQLEVIFGVAWVWLFAGEQLSVNTLSGGALVIGALVANELVRMLDRRKTRRLL